MISVHKIYFRGVLPVFQDGIHSGDHHRIRHHHRIVNEERIRYGERITDEGHLLFGRNDFLSGFGTGFPTLALRSAGWTRSPSAVLPLFCRSHGSRLIRGVLSGIRHRIHIQQFQSFVRHLKFLLRNHELHQCLEHQCIGPQKQGIPHLSLRIFLNRDNSGIFGQKRVTGCIGKPYITSGGHHIMCRIQKLHVPEHLRLPPDSVIKQFIAPSLIIIRKEINLFIEHHFRILLIIPTATGLDIIPSVPSLGPVSEKSLFQIRPVFHLP